MPDLKSLLNDEIRRLARKEVRAAVEPLLENISILKKTCAEQRKQLARLEKALQSSAPAEVLAAEEKPRSIRLNAAGIARIRGKLKLTQAEFARLLGVTMHTVSIWEQNKCAPRAAMKAKICELRHLGKRMLKQRLAASAGTESAAGE